MYVCMYVMYDVAVSILSRTQSGNSERECSRCVLKPPVVGLCGIMFCVLVIAESVPLLYADFLTQGSQNTTNTSNDVAKLPDVL